MRVISNFVTHLLLVIGQNDLLKADHYHANFYTFELTMPVDNFTFDKVTKEKREYSLYI